MNGLLDAVGQLLLLDGEDGLGAFAHGGLRLRLPGLEMLTLGMSTSGVGDWRTTPIVLSGSLGMAYLLSIARRCKCALVDDS
jgi:hypothetical protein